MSSCSVYGYNKKTVTEKSELNPITTYAKAKVRNESYILENDFSFKIAILRNATAFGFSPNIRLDLVINDLVYSAMKNSKIELLSDGKPKRPFVHVEDICNIIEHLIKNDFTEFVINISHLGHMIENHVKEKFSNINIEFSKEDKPLGTGGGILNAIDLLGDENFLVMNSDIFHKIDIKNLPKEIDAAHLIGVPNPSHNQEGDFCIKDNNKVAIDEFNDLTWSGISIINPIIFKEKNFSSGSFNIWDTVLPNYLNNGNVSAHKSNDLWIDVGTHERLKLANSLYNDQN